MTANRQQFNVEHVKESNLDEVNHFFSIKIIYLIYFQVVQFLIDNFAHTEAILASLKIHEQLATDPWVFGIFFDFFFSNFPQFPCSENSGFLDQSFNFYFSHYFLPIFSSPPFRNFNFLCLFLGSAPTAELLFCEAQFQKNKAKRREKLRFENGKKKK